jgi:hypothetical protein
MPADGFDAASKKIGTSARPAGSSQKAMGGTYISGKDVGRGVAVTVPLYRRYQGIKRKWLRHGQTDVSDPISGNEDRGARQRLAGR